MSKLLATMFTFTTYGTWLRGDQRGWVDDGVTYPANPQLEADDRRRMPHTPFRFRQADLLRVGQMSGDSLIARQHHSIFALTIQTWHVHLMVGSTTVAMPQIAKCAKDAVRWGLRLDRPIWTTDYDKRYCFDDPTVLARIAYIERHNLAMRWSAKPWSFITPYPL